MPAAISSAAEPELDRLLERISGYFALLAEPTRLKILNAICEGERSVGDIVIQVGSTQTNVSRHLNLMYAKSVLTRRREGSMTFYGVADRAIVTLCRTACVQFAGLSEDKAISARTLRRFMPKPGARR